MLGVSTNLWHDKERRGPGVPQKGGHNDAMERGGPT